MVFVDDLMMKLPAARILSATADMPFCGADASSIG
jgi:hypothetical protein